MTTGVVYSRYNQSAIIGKMNGDRQYQVDFSQATMKMGTFHFLDGIRVNIVMRTLVEMPRTSSCKSVSREQR